MAFGDSQSRSTFFKSAKRNFRKSRSFLKSLWVGLNIFLFKPTSFRPNACIDAQRILREELVGQVGAMEGVSSGSKGKHFGN